MVKGSTVLLVGGAAAVAFFAFTKQGQDLASSIFGGGGDGLGGIGGCGAGASGSGSGQVGDAGTGYYTYVPPTNQPNQNQGTNQPSIPTSQTQQVVPNTPAFSENTYSSSPSFSTSLPHEDGGRYTAPAGGTSLAERVNQQIVSRTEEINRQFGGELVTITQGSGYAGGTGSFVNINPEIAKNLTATQRQSILDNSFRDIIYQTGGNGGYTPIEGGLFFRTGTPSSNVNNLPSTPVQYQSVAPSSTIPTPSLQVQSNQPVIFNSQGIAIASSASGQNIYRSQAPAAAQTAQQPLTQPSAGINTNTILQAAGLALSAVLGAPLPTAQSTVNAVAAAPQQFMSYAIQSTNTSSSSNASRNTVPSSSNTPIQRASTISTSNPTGSYSSSTVTRVSSPAPTYSSPISNISQNLTSTQRSILSRGAISL